MKIYGLALEMSSPQDLQNVIEKTKLAGYSKVEAFAPYPDGPSIEKLKLRPSLIPAAALTGGILGGLGGFAIQYYTAVMQYPIDVGGRPLDSWPAFMPITFECTILGAALAIFVGFFIFSRFPQPYHPMFNIARFELTSRDKFFICIEAQDPLFDLQQTRDFLLSAQTHLSQASEVYDVPV